MCNELDVICIVDVICNIKLTIVINNVNVAVTDYCGIVIFLN